MKIQLTTRIKTSGTGFWSNVSKLVDLTQAEVLLLDDTFGELRVYFDAETWDVSKHGLIYTDQQFLDELRDRLMFESGNDFSTGAINDIHYSEQGMQGDNYVSFDIGADFIAELKQTA